MSATVYDHHNNCHKRQENVIDTSVDTHRHTNKIKACVFIHYQITAKWCFILYRLPTEETKITNVSHSVVCFLSTSLLVQRIACNGSPVCCFSLILVFQWQNIPQRPFLLFLSHCWFSLLASHLFSAFFCCLLFLSPRLKTGKWFCFILLCFLSLLRDIFTSSFCCTPCSVNQIFQNVSFPFLKRQNCFSIATAKSQLPSTSCLLTFALMN